MNNFEIARIATNAQANVVNCEVKVRALEYPSVLQSDPMHILHCDDDV